MGGESGLYIDAAVSEAAGATPVDPERLAMLNRAALLARMRDGGMTVEARARAWRTIRHLEWLHPGLCPVARVVERSAA